MKKLLIIIIVVVMVVLLGAFGTIFIILNKANEPTEEEKLKAAQEEINQITYEQLQKFQMEPMTIQIKKTSSKHDYLVIKVVINVKDEAMLTRVEGLQDAIADSINGIFENKTAQELEGKREEMKEPILQAVKNLFPEEEDKMQIISVYITDYKIAQ